ncbi:uncharacterized protein PV07_09869 [Cladophialophora immunda]|uniref:Uncharacterized protein n=1 Tax=Cladophialophora immunda TaxID=569365 RepID=A0A0D2AGZ6_9EURO|nr:uncharacterized protein PV07_09869 [Cladophialophora immunda]KIW24137.1 hypothetical protein PV07_09869 [Cladophialophora immunda]OQU99318.1 hypothetical protein CLAIMM_04964 [Cladophialophora immunda]
MPAMATALPSDEFDMAKLQKTLKQRQRHAARNSANVTKLTPAEIRSLNNGALASKTGSQSSSKTTSTQSRSRRSTNATPPATPDELPAYGAQTHRNSVSRNNSVNIPTPPHTPNAQRRSSQSSTHGHHYGHHVVHGHANGIIHAPRPRGSAQAAFMSANGLSSRPSSSGSSTYRGLPKYRGPEVTRTGSLTMLQYPSQKIVSNPLSYFSRPRQSQVSTSPEQGRHESPEISIYRAQSLRNARSNSVPNVSAPSSRPVSPPRVTDSPVSMIVDGTEKFPVLDPADDPHNQPKVLLDEEVAPNETNPENVDTQPKQASESPVEPGKQIAQPESPKKEKEKQKRFTLHAALFGGDKTNHESAENVGKLKKGRRRTLSFSKNYEAEKPENKTVTAVEAIDEVKVDGATIETEEFSTHPAIRPLSVIIPSEFKGKEKEIVCPPVYARCACCGKLKRPSGYSGELSPVLENENLRANFSFEIERTSGTSERRSSDASRHKFIPIIPMEVGENETRQATIEPYSGPPKDPVEHEQTPQTDMNIAASSPVRQPIAQMSSSPRRMKRHSTPARFTRFASLHGRRSVDSTVIAEEDEEAEAEGEADENQPLMSEHAAPEISGVVNQIVAAAAGADEHVIANSQPVIEPISSADRAFVEPVPMMATHDSQLMTSEIIESIPLLRPSSRSGSEKFSTPARGTTPVPENANFSPDATSIQPTDSTEAQFVVHDKVEDSSSSVAVDEPRLSTTTATTTTTITSSSEVGSPASPKFESEFSASFFDTPDLSLTPKFEPGTTPAGRDATSEKGKDKVTGKRKSTATEWVAEVMTVNA